MNSGNDSNINILYMILMAGRSDTNYSSNFNCKDLVIIILITEINKMKMSSNN